MSGTTDSIRIVGLTDLDRLTLETEFGTAKLRDALSFDEQSAPTGGAGYLDPITATVIVSGMAFTTLAIWICRSQTNNLTVEGPDGRSKIVISQSSNCKAEVLAQLVKLFPGVSR